MLIFDQVFFKSTLASTLLFGILSISSLSLATEQNPSVVVIQKGDAFVVEVDMFTLAKQKTAWDVLTDFDHMPNFLTNLTFSKTLRRDGSILLVKQAGVAKYGVLSFEFESEREIRLEPMHHIYSKNISGTTRRMESVASLIQEGSGVQIHYHAELVPDSAMAKFFGKSFIGHEVEEQFRLMLEEMKKRERKS